MRTVLVPNAEDFEEQCAAGDGRTAELARQVAAQLFSRGLLHIVHWFSLAMNEDGIPIVRFSPIDGILAQMALADVATKVRGGQHVNSRLSVN
jgi:hypothetical protein